jgi:hypothetical protein
VTGAEHYAKAAELVASVEAPSHRWPSDQPYPYVGSEYRNDVIARAQVHATLALAARDDQPKPRMTLAARLRSYRWF